MRRRERGGMIDVNELEQEAAEATHRDRATEAAADAIRDAVGMDDGSGGDSDVLDADFEEYISDDGDALPEDVRAELEALASEEFDDGASTLESALAEVQRELARQRTLTRQAVTRYRDALLAAEPDLPPDLVQGDTLEEVEASAASARQAVEHIRERVAMPEPPHGFPVGTPARSSERGHARGHTSMSAHEKIAAGLQERLI